LHFRLACPLQEELSVYNSVMAATGEALLRAGGALLAPEHVRELDYEGDADEFGQYLCETMATFGTSHLHTLGSPDKKILFLQQVSHAPAL
jgi:exportin-5